MKKKAWIAKEKCVGCGGCIAVCPSHAIYLLPGWKSEVDQKKCVGCGSCAAICHKKAITLLV